MIAGALEPEVFPVRVSRLDQTDLVHASDCILAGRDSGFTKQTASNSSSSLLSLFPRGFNPRDGLDG